MDAFTELLAEAMHGSTRKSAPDILPEAKIARLREAADRIAAPIPFKPGDIVTTRKDSPLKGVGQPRLVIEVNPDGFDIGECDAGAWMEAAKFDVRYLTLADGVIFCHQSPHWMLELYEA